MNKKIIKLNLILLALLCFILILLLANCASYQASLSKSGKIVKTEGKVYTLNIGKFERPIIGKTYKVFSYRTLIDKDSPQKTDTTKKQYIGEIKITELAKDNNAKGIIISGEGEIGDSVELKRRKFERLDINFIEKILK